MNDKRRIEIPVYPYIIFILGLISALAAGLFFINFPSQLNYTYGSLGLGIGLIALSIILRPALFKEIFASKKTLLWVNDLVLILTIIGIGVLVAHIGFRRNFRYDFTRNKMFSISDQTIKTLRSLDREVKISAFFPKNTSDESLIKDLLNEYKRQSDKLKVVFVDPLRDPMTTKAMRILQPGTIVVQCETNRKDIFPQDLIEQQGPNAGPDSQPRFKGEQMITSAIINVISGKKQKIQFVTGHGEGKISDFKRAGFAGANEILVRENYDVGEVSLLESDIEEDLSVLAIVSPKKDFLDSEITKIENFVNKNGRLLVALDPMVDTPRLDSFLTRKFGVLPNNNLVVDPRGIQNNYWLVAGELGNHQIVNPIRDGNLNVLMFHCRSLTIEARKGIKSSEILTTIPQAWAKNNVESGAAASPNYDEKNDTRGKMVLGAAIENTEVASGSKMIIFGDSDFASNYLLANSGHKDLLVNSVNWLTDQEQLISIRPKELETPRILLDKDSANRIFTLSVIISPLAVIIFGGIVFLIRRRV